MAEQVVIFRYRSYTVVRSFNLYGGVFAHFSGPGHRRLAEEYCRTKGYEIKGVKEDSPGDGKRERSAV